MVSNFVENVPHQPEHLFGVPVLNLFACKYLQNDDPYDGQ